MLSFISIYFYTGVPQPPGRGPVPGPGINYTGPREVLLEIKIKVKYVKAQLVLLDVNERHASAYLAIIRLQSSTRLSIVCGGCWDLIIWPEIIYEI